MMHHLYLTRNKSLTTKPTEEHEGAILLPLRGLRALRGEIIRGYSSHSDLAGLLGTRRFAHLAYF